MHIRKERARRVIERAAIWEQMCNAIVCLHARLPIPRYPTPEAAKLIGDHADGWKNKTSGLRRAFLVYYLKLLLEDKK